MELLVLGPIEARRDGRQITLGAAKQLCNRALQGAHGVNLRAECARLADVLLGDDAREGLAAFVEKRVPSYAETPA